MVVFVIFAFVGLIFLKDLQDLILDADAYVALHFAMRSGVLLIFSFFVQILPMDGLEDLFKVAGYFYLDALGVRAREEWNFLHAFERAHWNQAVEQHVVIVTVILWLGYIAHLPYHFHIFLIAHL